MTTTDSISSADLPAEIGDHVIDSQRVAAGPESYLEYFCKNEYCSFVATNEHTYGLDGAIRKAKEKACPAGHVDPSDFSVETFVYDDRGGVMSEVVISYSDIELVIVQDKPFRVKKKGVEVLEEQREPRVFWRRPIDKEPRGQL